MGYRTLNSFAFAASLAGSLVAYASAASAADSIGYVVSWFATATHATNFKENCPQNKNGGRYYGSIKGLMTLGYSEEEATKIMDQAGAQIDEKYERLIETRARVKGQPASIFNYPEAVKDPNIELSEGRHAWGFDLDGVTKPTDFTDPETGQRVDNQLWRAVGCTESFQAVPPDLPYFEDLTWHLMIDSAPAWAVQIRGADLSKDGPVEIILDKTVQHMMRDASGAVMSRATYVLDPSARSHNVVKGEIKNGALSVQTGDLYLEGEMPYYTEISLAKTHMRLQPQTADKLMGYWGGYTDWKKFAYMYTARPVNGEDVVGIYHALKKLADADPDPKTGENKKISTTFRVEMTPVYLADTSGKIVAKPGRIGTEASQARGVNAAAGAQR